MFVFERSLDVLAKPFYGDLIDTEGHFKYSPLVLGILVAHLQDMERMAPGSICSGEGAILDAKIWNKLPEELLERVLLYVPLHFLPKFRSICKKWNKYVLEDTFAGLREQVSPQKPWIAVTSDSDSFSAYDVGLGIWLKVPIPFNAYNLQVIAASGGLLCFSNAWFHSPGMYVCNPMTQKWRRLPPMNTWMISTVGMVYNDATATFNVLVCGRLENHSMITEVYDSKTDQWTLSGTPFPARKYGGDTSLWCNGIFYCLTYPFSTLCLLSYDLSQGTWHEVPVRMPSPIMSPSLVESRGKLLLIGGLEEQEVFSIQIWKLDNVKKEWQDVERMPSPLCKEFESRMVTSKPLSCFGTGDFVFFTIPTSGYMPALMFDLKHRAWDWWPASGFPPQLPDSVGHSCGISFEPRLNAHV